MERSPHRENEAEHYIFTDKKNVTQTVLAKRLEVDTNFMGPELRVSGFGKVGQWLIQFPDRSQTVLSNAEFEKRCIKKVD